MPRGSLAWQPSSKTVLIAFEELHKSVLRVSALLQELMVEHGMRIACVAACNFDCLHQLLTSNMETGLPAEPTFADQWRIVAVRPRLLLPSTFITPYPSKNRIDLCQQAIPWNLVCAGFQTRQ